jgi:mannose-6-phosphate isomerase
VPTKFESVLTFAPIYMERVWGGRRLAAFPGRTIPPGVPIGESWEFVDRDDAQSVVDSGPAAGMTLHELWVNHRAEVFGDVDDAPKFPVLAKVLDARDTLSVQVHPPAKVAVELGGEPKTEMWYLLDAEPDAALYAGFSRGVSRADVEAAIADESVEKVLHRIPARAGDTLFIPSGRCHAIGAGCLIVEIQQNSDTTYRVFDWNRRGLDGQARDLHVEASLRSIDFTDYEPQLAELPIRCAHFHTEKWDLDGARKDPGPGAALITVLAGAVGCGGREFHQAEFFLLSASAVDRELRPLQAGTSLLRTTLPPPTR